MNRFIIVNGLPFLYANGKAYRVRWDENGFTVGAEVGLASVPSVTYPELSIKAKCANLDSIADTAQDTEPATEQQQEAEQDTEPATEQQQEAEQDTEPATEQQQSLDDMSLAELKEYAKAHDIKLNGARTKDAIIEAIKGAAE